PGALAGLLADVHAGALRRGHGADGVDVLGADAAQRALRVGGADRRARPRAGAGGQRRGAGVDAVPVARVPDPVAIHVLLAGVGGPHAVVVLVHDAVAVPVGVLVAGDSLGGGAAGRCLQHVVDVGAVVEGVDDAVEVHVVEVADVADPVAVRIRLVGVRQRRAVVARVADPIAAAGV